MYITLEIVNKRQTFPFRKIGESERFTAPISKKFLVYDDDKNEIINWAGRAVSLNEFTTSEAEMILRAKNEQYTRQTVY